MKWIAALYVGSFAYAVARYVVFAPVNLEHLPVFVVNKSVSMAAACCFVAAFVQQFRRQRGRTLRVEPSAWFRAGVFGVVWHVPMALVVLRPAYFKEFFVGPDAGAPGRLSFAGELVFLFGGLAAATLYLLTRPSCSTRQRWWLSLAAMLLVAAHVLAMGFSRGLNINASHAYLPPMWLLSALGVGIGVVALVLTRAEASEAATRAVSSPRADNP